jgi:L-fuconate dehydratase
VNLELIPKLRHSLASTIGRGTEVQVTAVRSYAPLVVGLAVEDALQDPGAFSRRLGGDSPMRSTGRAPE